MTDAIGAVSEPERTVDAGMAAARKKRRGESAVGGTETVSAPAEPDTRGQLVDKEA